MNTIRIGSRESALSLRQTQIVIDAIKSGDPELEVELITMKTTGDRLLDKPLEEIGGKGVFVKELDQALLEGKVDICVHSLKDLAMEDTGNIGIVAVGEREDPRDALILPQDSAAMDPHLPIGSSSTRRRLQLGYLFPNHPVKSIRGNVLTRIGKLDRGEYGALVLAAAGLKRLDLSHRISRYFSRSEMVPACGQGIIAVTAVRDRVPPCLARFHHPETWDIAICERAFLRTVGGGCTSPAAAYGEIQGDAITLTGYVVDRDNRMVPGTLRGSRSQAESLGCRLGSILLREAER